MATDIASLQITVDSAQARTADDALDDLAISAKRAEDAVDNLGTSSQIAGAKQKALGATTTAATGRMGGFSKSAGQAGIQIQQLVGQIQGGQNAMQALSMQAADLGIVLGAPLVGVIVSLGAVLAGTLMTALRGASEEVEALTNDFDDLGDRFKEISITQLRALIIETEQQIKTLKDSGAIVSDTVTEFDRMEAVFGDLSLSFVEQNDNWNELDNAMTKGRSARVTTGEELNQLSAALEDYKNQLEILLGVQTESGGQQEASLAQLIDGYSQYYQMRLNANELIAQDNLLREQQEAEANARIAEGYTQYYLMRIRAAALEQEEYEQAQRDRQLEGYTQYYQARADSEIDAQKKANDALLQLEKDKLSVRGDLQSAFVQLTESQSRELFEIGKVGAASSAIVNAHEAASKALATLGPIAGPIAAGVMYAAGASQAANIMTRKFGDTSPSGAPNIPDVPVQSGGDTIQNTQTTINIAGDVSQPVFDQLQDLFDNDAVIIRPNTAQARALRA